MKTKKMNLQNIKNVLSRTEMKKIMAGSGPRYCSFRAPDGVYVGTCNGGWCISDGVSHYGSECA